MLVLNGASPSRLPKLDHSRCQGPPAAECRIHADATLKRMDRGLRLSKSDPLARVSLGAELNGTPSWGEDTPLDVADSQDTGRRALVSWLRDLGARESSKSAP